MTMWMIKLREMGYSYSPNSPGYLRFENFAVILYIRVERSDDGSVKVTELRVEEPPLWQ